ncbi:DUF4439 domain-containing protein [Ornithinimicrobium avium]|uniref:DUF4439 domain-containing protein n=2 Tax=Ornithinimicrobium avium TaxID=2283195 RepID=A0A345NIS2_9MICO|nr:DUF4439 domain-containing protein [Ornithinimicrobium avium]
MPRAVSRRAVLGALVGVGGATLLAGCDEQDPRTPLSPTEGVRADDPATWLPDTQLFIAVRQRVHGYRLALDVVAGRERTRDRLAELWRVQQERLELLITLGGVPLPDLLDDPAVAGPGDGTSAPADGSGDRGVDGTTATGGADAEGSTSTGAGPARPDAEVLGRVLRRDHTEACRELSTATATNVPTLASLAAQHVAAAAWLGAPVPWGEMAGPSDAAAVPVLAVARPAVFGLEVVAARSRDEERADYESVLEPLRSVTRQLATLAGAAAPVAPLGYDLPEPLETAEQRRALARRLVADIAPATLEAAQRLPGRAAELTGVVRVVSDTVVWDRALGTRALPFPGMTLP